MNVAEVLAVLAVAAVVMVVGSRLALSWIDRPLQYPSDTTHCVCQRRYRMATAATAAAVGLLVASVAVAVAGAWVSLLGLAGMLGLVVLGQRLYWQTRWAHREGRCCCPGRHESDMP